MSAVNTRHSVS